MIKTKKNLKKDLRKCSKEDLKIQLRDQYDLKIKAAAGSDCKNLTAIKFDLENQCLFCGNTECGKDRSPNGKSKFIKNKTMSRSWDCESYFQKILTNGTDPISLEETFDSRFNNENFPLDDPDYIDIDECELKHLLDDPEGL